MKRIYFIFLLILIFALFFYSPRIDNVNFLGPGCENQNQRKNNDGKKGYCFPLGTQGLITQSYAQVPVDYFYENVKTTDWVFDVEKGEIKKIKTKFESAQPDKSQFSNENCRYYAFYYERKPLVKTYNLPFTRTVQTQYGSSCLYSIEPIWDDLKNIEALGGNPLLEAIMQALQSSLVYKDLPALGTICSRWLVNGKICLPTTSDLECNKNVGSCFGEKCTASCLNRVGCEIDIFRGEKEYFGVSSEIDKCGKYVVKVDNNGKAISQQEIETRAKDFVDACSVKYQTNLCGNGKIEEGEECDAKNLNGKTCQSLGYKEGTLNCAANCKFDTSECTKEISGQVIIKITSDFINENNKVIQGDNAGKVIVSLNSNIKGDKPTELNYKLHIEGGIVFLGVYGTAMEQIANDIPPLWNILEQTKSQGIYSLGIVEEVEKDGLTLKKIYSSDLALNDLLEKEDENDWKASEINVKINYKKEGSTVTVSQDILNLAKNKLLARKSTAIELDGKKTEELTRTLFLRVASFASKTQGSVELTNKKPVVDNKDKIAKIKSSQYNPGTKLKILWKVVIGNIYVNINKTYEKIDVQKILDYANKAYSGQGSAVYGEVPEVAFSLNEASLDLVV